MGVRDDLPLNYQQQLGQAQTHDILESPSNLLALEDSWTHGICCTERHLVFPFPRKGCTLGRQAQELAQGGMALRSRQAWRERQAPGRRAGIGCRRISRRRDALQNAVVILVQPAMRSRAMRTADQGSRPLYIGIAEVLHHAGKQGVRVWLS